MHSVLNLITATSFLAHMLVGCCWHHAHACNDHADSRLVSAHTSVDCDPHGHQHADHSDPGEHEGELPHDDCDGQSCVAVFDLSLHGPHDAGLAFALVATLDVSPQTAQVFASVGQRMQVECDTGPTIRPHLAHQVLLI